MCRDPPLLGPQTQNPYLSDKDTRGSLQSPPQSYVRSEILIGKVGSILQ